jgi:hypothetical protein
VIRRVLLVAGLVLATAFWGDEASYAAESMLTVGADNTVASSWWQAGAWEQESGTVVAPCTCVVELPQPTQNGGPAPAGFETDIWRTGEVPDRAGTYASGDPNSVGEAYGTSATINNTVHLVAGQSYTETLTSFSSSVGGNEYQGSTIGDGGALDAIAAATGTDASGGGGMTPPSEVVKSGIFVDPTSGEVEVHQSAYVAVGAGLWIAAIVAGLGTAKLVLP